MSVMCCDKCDRYIDTDFDVEGVWIDEYGNPSNKNPDRLVCSSCCEKHFTAEQMEEYDNPVPTTKEGK